MYQVLQHLNTGVLQVTDVPTPLLQAGALLIQSRVSLISAGTERMLVEFGKASLLQKARSQPEKVQQVLDKIKTDGLLPTLEAVFNRLDEPLPLGYCNAGVVLEAGAGAEEFRPGDRVASNGPHAEVVCVPKHLCARIPDEVGDEDASFTVLSSIGLQGIRLLQPTLGEKIVVYGLGLIGLISVQLLRAHGADVMGIDLNPERLRLAEGFGAAGAGGSSDPMNAAMAWTGGKGVDGVLITAAAKSDGIVHNSARMCRKRGRIVLVGVVDLALRRSDFYEKELRFQVSCSYGPGRYDSNYEHRGNDYPYGLVRWTEQRNFEAVLETMRSGRLNVDALVSHRFPLAQASAAYETVQRDPAALGVMLRYPVSVERASRVKTAPLTPPTSAQHPVVGVIGAGTFSKVILMPALRRTSARIAHVADLNPVAARHLASKYGAANAVTDYKAVLEDPNVNAVMIAVGHHLHAKFVCEALEAGKHVLVEKPLAMNVAELKRILETARRYPDRQLMVGFNRRFSRHVIAMRRALEGRSEPLAMTMTVNAGMVPREHWVHDPVLGGGRIIGEACHFIDLMVHLAGSLVKTVSAVMSGQGATFFEDRMSILLGFEDGSLGVVNYFANGARSYPKELLEVFSEGRTLRLENFRRTLGYGFGGFRTLKTWRQDKGHVAEFASFVDRIAQGGDPLIPLGEMASVTLATFAAMASAREGRTVCLQDEYPELTIR